MADKFSTPPQPAVSPTAARPEVPWRPPAGNTGDPQYWRAVDAAYGELVREERARDPYPWLLLQTVATGVLRRSLYPVLGMRPGARVLDVGTGFGPVAVELAGAFGCRVVGVDSDGAQLKLASTATDNLRAASWLQPRDASDAATVSLATGRVGSLPFGDGVFDAVVARFLLQHLEDPFGAVTEMARVTRPGGLICVIDVDDGLCLSYPQPPEPLRLLEEAYQKAQRDRGGDRTIGRKVAGMLDAAGVAVVHVLVVPQAGYGQRRATDEGQKLLHSRLSAVAGELAERGLLDEATAAEGLHVLATQDMPAATIVDMHLAVIGRRR